jgi:D-alanyl-D-alanine carboxypeptidase (penicillin-binding protein 5/6)
LKTWRVRIGVVAVLLAASMSLLAPTSASAATFGPPALKVPSSILMTMDGTVLWSRRPDAHRRVASTIKLLNALVLRDATMTLDTTVTVPHKASAINDGDVGLVTGQKVTLRQLLDMMLVASANDAAEAVAIRVAGSEQAYVARMNAKARSLGLLNTHAVDPHGLSKRETSTASDLAVLARTAMADPVLRAIVRKRSVVVPRPKHKPRVFASTDQLLGHYAGIEGVKTGFTNPAGYCFIGAALRGPVELMGVVLGAKSIKGRFSEMRKLLDWGFAHTHLQTLVSRDTTMGSVAVDGSSVSTVTVHAGTTVSRVLLDGGPLETTVTLPASVAAPVVRGQRLGTVEVGRGGVTLAVVPLLADADAAVEPAFAPTLRALVAWIH